MQGTGHHVLPWYEICAFLSIICFGNHHRNGESGLYLADLIHNADPARLRIPIIQQSDSPSVCELEEMAFCCFLLKERPLAAKG